MCVSFVYQLINILSFINLEGLAKIVGRYETRVIPVQKAKRVNNVLRGPLLLCIIATGHKLRKVDFPALSKRTV